MYVCMYVCIIFSSIPKNMYVFFFFIYSEEIRENEQYAVTVNPGSEKQVNRLGVESWSETSRHRSHSLSGARCHDPRCHERQPRL
jgi:hypothetical protein